MSIVISDLEVGLDLDIEALTALRGGCTSGNYADCYRTGYGASYRYPYSYNYGYRNPDPWAAYRARLNPHL
jgi:hypothetical protein